MNKLFTLLALSLFMWGCSKDDDDNVRVSGNGSGKEIITDNQAIIGTWKATDSNADITGMEFTEYGVYYYCIKGEAVAKTGTYRYEKGKLYVKVKSTDDAPSNYVVDCSVEGGELLYDSQNYYTRGVKVLFIGSSHGMNTIGQFPILANNSGIDVICANAYQGSLSLRQVADYCISGRNFGGWYKKFYDGIWHASNSVTILQMLQDEKWDFISIQRSASEDMTWTDEQKMSLETILDYISANCNYTPTIVFNSGFADSYSISTRQAQQNDSKIIWDTAQQVKATYGLDIIPMAPVMQLVRDNDTLASLGTYQHNMLSCDTQHLDQGIGMYVSGCICFNFFLKYLGRSVLSCKYLPTVADMTPFWYDLEKFTPIDEQYAREIQKIVDQYYLQ